jgi:serine/threonine-protein kinase 11
MVDQDVKPSNILLFEGIVKLAGFGIGHRFASAETVIGTPAYQAPEFLEE